MKAMGLAVAQEVNCCKIPITLIDPGKFSTGVIAFHEKAGRSQVDSSWFWLVIVVFPAAVATVATLPSALFGERLDRSVQVGCSRFSRCCHLIIDLAPISAMEVGLGD